MRWSASYILVRCTAPWPWRDRFCCWDPTNPKLIGNVPGVAIGADGRPIKKNDYATPADPYCVPVHATGKDGNTITDNAGNPVYAKNTDGAYVCDPNTVPERAMAYRSLLRRRFLMFVRRRCQIIRVDLSV